MTDERSTKTGSTERAHHAGDDEPATPRQRRMSAQRRQEAVLRVLRGEDLELVSRELGVTASALSGWRDSFLGEAEPWRQWRRESSPNGAASLKSRPEDDRDRELRAMREKIGEISMANERQEGGVPFRLQR